MIKAIIIDDEPLAASIVREYLHNHQVEVLAECRDGFDGAKQINELRPDLVFLDVQMPKITGFEMLEILDHIPHIVFTTAFEEHALKAFEANAVDYLLKPFSQKRFDEAMHRVHQKSGEDKNRVEGLASEQKLSRLVLRDEGKIRIVPNDEIYYLEADDDYTTIYTEQGRFVKKATLKRFENQFSEYDFVRVHRSFLVNVIHITRIEPYEKTSHLAILKSGAKVPVSRSGYARVKEVLGL
ncbi:MAG: LytTR family DNA-binding domain-containing protein [Salibacteraceae bacterium]